MHSSFRRKVATMARLSASLVLIAAMSFTAHPAWGAEDGEKIVLIGGTNSHSPGQHDFYHGISLIQSLLEDSTDAQAVEGLTIEAYPLGWPKEEDLENASTVVLYLDGVGRHPLLDARRRAQFDKLMKRGVGLITLHQASTVPAEDRSIDFPRWLGGARYGMFDRVTTTAKFAPASGHPISRGVGEFIHHDEFYPTIRFIEPNGRVTPILRGDLHVDTELGKSVVVERKPTTVAWAFEREDGGRSFSFTGLHYLRALDEPAIRKVLLNAIFWTAGVAVPDNGVRTNTDPQAARKLANPGSFQGGRMTEAVLTSAEDNKVDHPPWGRLDWYVSGELGNSETMTVGLATVHVGKSNPRHVHPNCDEVLHVISGHIRHTMNEQVVEMKAGDTVSIPQGTWHNATNLGTEDAVLSISFNSAWRVVVGE